MLGVLLSILVNPYALLGLVAAAAIGAIIWFTAGPVKFVAIVTDIRTWFVLGAILAVLAYANVVKQNRDLKASFEAATVKNQATSDKDAQAVTQTRAVAHTKRATQSSQLQEKIDHAQPGQAEDDVMDAIADQLTACASAPTGLLSPESLYPPAITACADEPAVPPRPASGQPRDDKTKASYTEALHAAWGDCHDTVDAVAARKTAYQGQYDAAQAKAKGGLHLPVIFKKKAAS
jgi:hypothetical protein